MNIIKFIKFSSVRQIYVMLSITVCYKHSNALQGFRFRKIPRRKTRGILKYKQNFYPCQISLNFKTNKPRHVFCEINHWELSIAENTILFKNISQLIQGVLLWYFSLLFNIETVCLVSSVMIFLLLFNVESCDCRLQSVLRSVSCLLRINYNFVSSEVNSIIKKLLISY